MPLEASKKEIWILLPNLSIGGAEVFLSSLASELSHSFDFVFFVNNSRAEITLPNAKIYTHRSTLHFLSGLTLKAWRTPPDIILSSIIDVNVLSLIMKPFIPRSIKHIIREALPIQEACQLTRAPQLYLWLARQTYPMADAVVNLSEELSKHLEETIPGLSKNTKIATIPNGVPKERISDRRQPPSSSKKVVAIGRLEYQKGFDQLIPAFSKFTSLNPNYQLIVIGEGSQRKNLQALVDKHDKNKSIRLIGKVIDPISELCTADFFVLPSRYEGLSNAMLEALINGVPVLATKRNTSAENLINEHNGVLIESSSDQEIFEGLIKMDENLTGFSRDEIAESSKKRFSIERSAKEYSKLMNDVLNIH